MLRGRSNGYGTPQASSIEKREQLDEPPSLNERNIARIGLIFSLSVICLKLLHLYGSSIEQAILEQKLVNYKVLTQEGNEMLMYSWKSTIRYSVVWLPLACGFLITYLTAMMVYLDSKVPGVQPPTPLSPQKYKIRSGHTFHLNYLFAIVIGVMTTSYMYFRGVSLEY